MQEPGVQPLACRKISPSSKWRSGASSLAAPKREQRFGVERLPAIGSRRTLRRACLRQAPPTFSLRKEVIQPQVLLRLPCYDFTPIMDHTLGRCPPCGSACELLVQSTFVM